MVFDRKRIQEICFCTTPEPEVLRATRFWAAGSIEAKLM
jgi:hypothetical protein